MSKTISKNKFSLILILLAAISFQSCKTTKTLAKDTLEPGAPDAAVEKHVPVVNVEGNKVSVSVGSVAHPMLPEHYIEWVILVTDKGIQKKQFKPGDEPKAEFALLDGEKVITAYEFCNLHKLWKC